MTATAALHVVRVFVDDAGHYGNPLGVFLAGEQVPEPARQAVAAELGFSETVFVDGPVDHHADGGRTVALRIFTPTLELPLAGHPLVGTAWLLAATGHDVDVLHPPAGRVPVRTDPEGLTWIDADPETAPPWRLHEVATPAEVEALDGDPLGGGSTCAWAWADRPAGLVRSRVFAGAYGVPEDPATGSAALRLGAHLRTPLRIVQGSGSVLVARPGSDGRVLVGGRCRLVEQRPFALPQ